MPEKFDACARNGGRVRRVSGPNKEHGLAKGEYVNYCFLKGKSYRGYVKQAEHSEKAAKRAYKRKAAEIASKKS